MRATVTVTVTVPATLNVTVPVTVTAIAFVVATLALATHAGAQVVAHPNQYVGTVRFSNATPEITALLAQRWTTASVQAVSDDRDELTALTSVGCPTPGAPCPYELSAESADAGRPYLITATLAWRSSRFESAPRPAAPLFPEPAPDVAHDIVPCAALLRVRWTDGAGAPVRPVGASISIERSDSRFVELSSSQSALTGDVLEILCDADGRSWTVELAYEFGSDPLHDTIRMEDTWTFVPECDVVHEVTIDASRCMGDPNLLPRIVGVVDVLGESERELDGNLNGSARTVVHGNGPFWNERYDRLRGEPCSGPFELENLVPSAWSSPPRAWSVYGRTSMRHGVSFVDVMQHQDVVVPDSGTVDVGDAFILDPADVSGSVRLVGPPPDIAAEPALADVDFRSGEADGGTDWHHPSAISGQVIDPAHRRGDPSRVSARTGIDGMFDPTTGTFTGAYSMPAGGLHAAADWWHVDHIQLRASRIDDAVPTRHRQIVVDLHDYGLPVVWAEPGSAHAIDHAYCLSDVYLEFESDALLYRPAVTNSEGSLLGRDFEGRTRDMRAWIQHSIGTPTEDAAPANRGLVVLPLPEGDYVLEPSTRIVNPGGGTSHVQLPDIALRVGCRQVIWLTGELQLTTDSVAACTGEVPPHVTVSVRSSRPVVRVAHSVNGAPEIVDCLDCGVSPTVVIPLDVGLGDAEIVVRSVDDEGRQASTTVFTTRLREVSPLDLRPDAPPLTVTKSGASDLALAWERLVPAARYALGSGTIRSLHVDRFYDHLPVACDLADPATVLPAQPGDRYFLVTEGCKLAVGPTGRDSLGRERPQRAEGCR